MGKYDDFYERISGTIAEQMEEGKLFWKRNYQNQEEIRLPMNLSTGNDYHGSNVILLWLAGDVYGHARPIWLTFNQAKALGGMVRKGEKAQGHILCPMNSKRRKSESEEEYRKRYTFLGMRPAAVFHYSQCDGLDDKLPPPAYDPTDIPPIQKGELFLEAFGSHVKVGGHKARYLPGFDRCELPDRDRYTKEGSFYLDLFHELGHFTGHKSRLDRKPYKEGEEGIDLKQQYAYEELVAELCAAFTQAKLGITGDFRDSSAYIQGWIKLLREDIHAFTAAASEAKKAHEWLMGEYAAHIMNLPQHVSLKTG